MPNPLLHNPDFWTNVGVIEKLLKKKLCLASNVAQCEGSIVQAHTIPRSQLRKIAVDGQVYEIGTTSPDLARNDGEYTYKKRGVGQFSVLNCFCEKHDREIFSAVEVDDLIFDARQLSILHYRAMGAELYKKVNAVEVSTHALKKFKDESRHDAVEYYELIQAGQMMGLRDVGITFQSCEEIVFAPSYHKTSGLVVKFKRKPSIMAVGGFIPEYDYNGARLTRLGIVQPALPQVGLSVLIGPDGAAVALTWNNEAQLCRTFAETLIAQPANRLTTLIIQTAFEHVENICMNIEWWDALSPAEQKALLRRAQSGTPHRERRPNCLQFDGLNHDQWEYQGHVFVN